MCLLLARQESPGAKWVLLGESDTDHGARGPGSQHVLRGLQQSH